MHRLNKKIIFFLSAFIFLSSMFTGRSFAQEQLFYNGYVQFASNNFNDGENHFSTYFYNGLRYQTKDYSLSFSLPIILTDNSSLNQVGNMILTNDNSKDGAAVQNNNTNMGHGMNNMSAMNLGIGDLYAYGSYNVLSSEYNFAQITLDGYIKFPTAVSSFNNGTGKFDYSISFSVRKNYKSILLYSQIGYLVLGNTETIDYKNPFTVSIGIGSNFNSLNHSLYFGFDSYSSIVPGIESPKQISLGYSYIVTPSISYNFITSYGLNSSTSDFIFSGGINVGLL